MWYGSKRVLICKNSVWYTNILSLYIYIYIVYIVYVVYNICRHTHTHARASQRPLSTEFPPRVPFRPQRHASKSFYTYTLYIYPYIHTIYNTDVHFKTIHIYIYTYIQHQSTLKRYTGGSGRIGSPHHCFQPQSRSGVRQNPSLYVYIYISIGQKIYVWGQKNYIYIYIGAIPEGSTLSPLGTGPPPRAALAAWGGWSQFRIRKTNIYRERGTHTL